MNLAQTLELYGGGPGSGCSGENCGRPPGPGHTEDHERRNVGKQRNLENQTSAFMKQRANLLREGKVKEAKKIERKVEEIGEAHRALQRGMKIARTSFKRDLEEPQAFGQVKAPMPMHSLKHVPTSELQRLSKNQKDKDIKNEMQQELGRRLRKMAGSAEGTKLVKTAFGL